MSKILGIGRNFEKHARELKNPVPSSPFFFLKPFSSLFLNDGKKPVVLPPQSTNVHHEVELGVVIGSTAKDVKASSALDYVSHYVVALDMTARDLQEKAKKDGMPWSVAKGFDTFCPVSGPIAKAEVEGRGHLTLFLEVNGVLRQEGSTADMIFKVPELIQYCSSMMTLERGDIILTGTPEGVGPVKAGDVMTWGIRGLGQVQTTPVVNKE